MASGNPLPVVQLMPRKQSLTMLMTYGGEDFVKSMTLYPYTEAVEIDLDDLITSRRKASARATAAHETQRDMEELARLQAKYPDDKG